MTARSRRRKSNSVTTSSDGCCICPYPSGRRAKVMMNEFTHANLTTITTIVFALIKCSITQSWWQSNRQDETQKRRSIRCVVVVVDVLHPLFLPHTHTHIYISKLFISLHHFCSRLPPDELSPERDRVIKSARCRF